MSRSDVLVDADWVEAHVLLCSIIYAKEFSLPTFTIRF